MQTMQRAFCDRPGREVVAASLFFSSLVLLCCTGSVNGGVPFEPVQIHSNVPCRAVFCVIAFTQPAIPHSVKNYRIIYFSIHLFLRFAFIEQMSGSRLYPFGPLPFAYMSSMFSCCVPKNRCAGLQHRLLSQRCRTFIPFGIGPSHSSHAYLCDDTVLNASREPIETFIRPYPTESHPSCHSQQSDSVMTTDL